MPSLKGKSAQRQRQWQPKMRRTSLTTFCHVQQSAHELLKVLQHLPSSSSSSSSGTHSSLQACISVCICKMEAYSYVSGMWAWQQQCVCCLSFAVCSLPSCCSPHSNACPSSLPLTPFSFSVSFFTLPLPRLHDNIKCFATHPG